MALYYVYVEGKLHEICLTNKKAMRLRRKFEKEGWNVKVVKFTDTVIGNLGV